MKTFKKSFIKKKLLGKASAKETFRESFIKAQSAMEYLMTYGWAILIVAVVLGALYSLGVFNGAAFLGTSCISASGFYCTNPTLSTGGALTVTIGQATGTTFNNAYLYFVPSGTNFSTSDPGTSIGTLNSGQQVTASIPLDVGSPYPAAYTLGTPISGYLYLQFTDIYGTTEVNKIATVLTKVTATSSVVLSQPSSIPSGIVAYVPITLTNSQSSATPSPFQQMIQINEGNYANYVAYNGNIANFEFFTQSGQILPAWIESNNSGTLTVWVKLPNGIPASSSLTIYLGFASKTTNLLSSSGTSGIGEAPQLSSTYAQYDDGASVFGAYDNFAGTSLSSQWTEINSPTLTINNGITMTGNGQVGGIALKTKYSFPAVLEAYSGGTWSYAGFMFVDDINGAPYSYNGWWVPGASSGEAYNGVVADPWGTTGGDAFQYAVKGYGYAVGSSVASTILNNIVSIYSSGSQIGQLINYGSTNSQSTSASLPSTTYNIEIGAANGYSISLHWLRVRAYPPNGVMPSVSFSGLSTA